MKNTTRNLLSGGTGKTVPNRKSDVLAPENMSVLPVKSPESGFYI